MSAQFVYLLLHSSQLHVEELLEKERVSRTSLLLHFNKFTASLSERAGYFIRTLLMSDHLLYFVEVEDFVILSPVEYWAFHRLSLHKDS